MGGAMSRNKGQRGERAVIALLQPILDRVAEETGTVAPELTRNLIQAHKGGDDVVGLLWLSVEVKHQETFSLPAWWEQAQRQARGRQRPVLFYRRNGTRWTVRMEVRVPTTAKTFVVVPADVGLDDFLAWFELRARHEAVVLARP